ncbi:ABC transporter substrate-binding protein [Alkalinema pantanalense CENA528]|uniref:ABC transporter substrate-binding protein n=1 Tax=Alkalinema pantanalense TaxID=1620705 RepID=UPI003D6F943C
MQLTTLSCKAGIVMIVLSLMLNGCASSVNQANNTTRDEANSVVPPTGKVASPTAPISQAKRVVALSSLSADIIHRLDKTKLVGITGSRLLNQNPEFAQMTRVAEGRTPPNLEKILALKPDLVIGSQGFHDQVLQQLGNSGIATLATEVDSWQSLEAVTRQLAAAIGVDPNPLLQSYQSFIRKGNSSKSVLVLAGDQPIMTPNKQSWTGDLLQQFGLKNVTADLQQDSPMRGYVSLSPEKILQANPDILIVVDTGEGIEKFKSAAFWKDLRAVKENQVYTFDYYGLVNAGSIGAIEQACKKLQREILALQS